MACFTIAMIIMGLGECFDTSTKRNAHFHTGTGFFKSNISPLVAEQYRRTKLFVSTTKTGERVIVDPIMTVSSVYMVGNTSFGNFQ